MKICHNSTNINRIGPKLMQYGCFSLVSWLSLKMDDHDLFFQVMGIDFNMKICNFHL